MQVVRKYTNYGLDVYRMPYSSSIDDRLPFLLAAVDLHGPLSAQCSGLAGALFSGGATYGGVFQDVAVTYGRVAMTWMKTFEHSANFSYCVSSWLTRPICLACWLASSPATIVFLQFFCFCTCRRLNASPTNARHRDLTLACAQSTRSIASGLFDPVASFAPLSGVGVSSKILVSHVAPSSFFSLLL